MRVRDRVSALLLVSCLVGCASHSDKPLPRFERFAVVNETGHSRGPVARSTLDRALSGAADGGQVGGASGVAAGLACGPLAALCVPAGWVVGTVVGSSVGAISQARKGVPSETANEINDSLRRLQETRAFDRDLFDALVKAMGDAVARQESAEATVLIRLNRVELRQHPEDQLSLAMQAVATVEWNLSAKKPNRQTNHYEYETARAGAENWLANDGSAFRNGVDECIENIVNAMMSDLGI